jgi:SSS family solute:Na+ symporter
MVQRVLGAKNLDHGRWGALFAGALKLPIIFIMVLPGTFARLLYPVSQYPNLENPDYVFPTMMFDLLPPGLRGLIITALIAAIMSSVDSTLNSASTLVTMDFVKKLKPEASRKTLVWVGRVTTFIFMIFAAAWAPQIIKFPTIWQYLQEVLSYIAPPVVACFVFGIFWRRASATGAFTGLVGGHLAGLLLFYLRSIAGVPLLQFHFLYISVVLFCVASLMLVVVSLATPAPALDKVDGLTWTPELFRRETRELQDVPWYKNYRIQSAILAAATFIFVFLFR